MSHSVGHVMEKLNILFVHGFTAWPVMAACATAFQVSEAFRLDLGHFSNPIS